MSAKTATTPEMKEMLLDDWKAEGEKRFGEDLINWCFVCCNCGHVQAVSDFRELLRLEIFQTVPSLAYFSCIGRYDNRIPRNQIGKLGDTEGKDCCDYTLGGLIMLNKLVVIMPEGARSPVFEFAQATIKDDTTPPDAAEGQGDEKTQEKRKPQ